MMALVLAAVLALSPVGDFASRHLLWHVNKDRQSVGLDYLRRDLTLDGVAHERCAEMLASGVMSDDTPGVMAKLRTLRYRYRAVGIIAGWVYGYRDPESALSGLWMASPEHLAIIVGSWRRFGGAICGSSRVYATVLFSR